MDELIKDFLIESNENLDRLDQELVKLESDPSSRELLSSIFRTIHTIKGSCGFLGFAKLEKVAHTGESLLSLLRDGKIVLSEKITSGLLAMVDAVRRMLAEISATEQDGQDEYPELVKALTELQGSALAPQAPPPSPPPSTQDVAAVAPPPSAAASAPPPATPMPQDLKAKEGTSASPADGSEARHTPLKGKIGGLLVEKGISRPEDIVRALREQEGGDRRRLGEILSAMGLAKAEDIQRVVQSVEDSRAHDAPAETLRVGVKLLDNLMTLVGELVLARNQLLQFSTSIEDARFQTVSQHMNLIASELQEEVMKTRMQPIGNIWSKFPRTVRDVATSCQKEVRIEMEGEATELDKTIIEAIKDPLTHLVRNAVDHGIETPEARLRAGKDRAGRLFLRAYHEGGQVNIEISDDGAGLNQERIRRKAIERGLASPEQAARMTERELFHLIFLPGFSTSEKVTNVSGRGVGMDVVKTNVERIGGTVDVTSKIGDGTTVRVKIPLTLAIIPALIVETRGERFAIPQINLTELVRLEAGDSEKAIELVHGAPVYRLRCRLLPLIYLRTELRLEDRVPPDSAKTEPTAVNIVVLESDGHRFGLIVDEIRDSEEIVVKPLRKSLKNLKMYAGASIMGDGKIALILDVPSLGYRAGVLSRAAMAEKEEEARMESKGEKHEFLLFAGPDDARMALTLDRLARLEEMPRSQLESAGVETVVQYRGKILPLIHLASVLEERRHEWRHPEAHSAAAAQDRLQVLVCNHEGGAVGLVVDRILDVLEASVDVKYPATRTGVSFSTVIDGRVTELIDIPAVLHAAKLHQSVEHAEVL